MKISDVLSSIDQGTLTLPQFQRGFVWNRGQVRALLTSLYRRHPVGALLVWVTGSETAAHRGDGILPPGSVKLLLDGQQRLTTLYGVMRGKPPPFFDGNRTTLTGLRFHLGEEAFEFYQPVKMRDDPLWIDVTTLMQAGFAGIGPALDGLPFETSTAISRITRLLGIADVDLPQQELVGEAMTLDVVVDIFNQVNSGGTKLSKGDLALSRICADWPEGRQALQRELARWEEHGYRFSVDWLLRCVNTVVTGRAEFSFLRQVESEDVRQGVRRASRRIDQALELIAARTGLDHARVLFGPFAFPVIVRYLEQTGKPVTSGEEGKLLFWYLQAGMWGRFSGSMETRINEDIHAVETGGLDDLLERLRIWRGGLGIEPHHFDVSTIGARFYAVLYFLTRMGEARDFCCGLPLKAGMLGKMSSLEVHHIFPKKILRNEGYDQRQVNALANFSFLTKDCNLSIGVREPEDYFFEVCATQPGALESQWIPMDRRLWAVSRFPEFLAERRRLLAKAANMHLAALVDGDPRWVERPIQSALAADLRRPGGTASEREQETLDQLRMWMRDQRLPEGELSWDLADETTGEQLAVVDLAWPRGVQPGLSAKVAVLVDEDLATHRIVADAGFQCFESVERFRDYVRREVLGDRSE